MNLIVISGPCGSGKSTLVSHLSTDFEFVNIVYKNCKGANLDSSLVESKIDYTKKWFSSVRNKLENNKSLIFSDRSPFDCCAYIKEDITEYRNMIDSEFNSLNLKGVQIINILLTAEERVLKDRIIKRSKEINENKIKTENQLKQLSDSLLFYKKNDINFVEKINNTYLDENQTFLELKKVLKKIKILNY